MILPKKTSHPGEGPAPLRPEPPGTSAAAGIDREIAATPIGMPTPVGASRAVIPGGEGQRLTIARAPIRTPRAFLLDEATRWPHNGNQTTVM